jgi:hypothetical protein
MTPPPVAEDGAPGRRRPAAVAVSVLLAGLFVVGFLVVASTVVVRTCLLDAGVYTSAMARSDAYDRVYTEVLADPELADVLERLLGDLDLPTSAPAAADLRTLGTTTARLALPPATLRRSTEAVVVATLAYVRGDADRLAPDLDVQAVLDRVDDAAEVHVAALLASVRTRVSTSVAEHRAALTEFVDDLSAGDVPAAVPVLATTDPGVAPDPATVVDAIVAAVGPRLSPEARARVEAAALTGDQRDALVEAVGVVVDGRAADTVRGLRADLEAGRELDVVGEIADHAHRSRAQVVDQLDTVRSAAGLFGPATAAAGGALMVAAGAGLVWQHRRRPRRAVLVVAATAAVAGLSLLVVWLLVLRTVGAPLAAATDSGPGSWGLPAGLRGLVGDVTGEVAGALAARVVRLALVPLAAGFVLAVCVVATAPSLRAESAALRARVGARASAGASAGAPRLRRGGLVAGVAATVAVAAAAALVVVGPGHGGGDDRACNGSVELCERRYDQVAYAATHNSMSSPDVVSVWPEHDGDIAEQLDFGIRALLIDTHHWTPVVSAEQLEQGDPGLPPAVAERVLATLGDRSRARPGTYLCHNQCALGSMPLVDGLAQVQAFLDANPDEVVTLIVQDAISPEETAEAFAAAGLDPYLHVHEPGEEWATLGELVDRNERLVVFAEEAGPPPPWYLQAFENMQDTPFHAEEPDQLSCVEARGDPDAPLFLMNHWISRLTPDRATAALVNRREVLVDRARRCESERGLAPNYLAVDFFGIGDVTGAVDELNGIG